MSPNTVAQVSLLDPERKILLQQFRSAVSDVLQPKHDDKFLLRFLKSRDFDLVKAEKMIRESMKFRKKIGTENLLESGYELPELVKKHMPIKFIGFDKDGSPVRIFLIGICDVKGFIHTNSITEVMKVVAYYLETDLKKVKEAQEQRKTTNMVDERSVYVFDFSGFTIRPYCDKSVVNAGIQLILMYQDNYPELMKACYLVNAPHYFSWVFNLFKPFIDSNTMSKIRICKTDEWKKDIAQHVDKSVLPKNFGGIVDDPECNPKVRVHMNDGMKFPIEKYLKGGMSLNSDEPGMKQVTIRERSKHRHEIDVEKPGTIIRWVFQTKDYNIRFGVFFKNSSNLTSKSRSSPEELIQVDTVDSQTLPERGELICEKAGHYILHFDNSYSWLTGKQLIYKVDTEDPKQDVEE